MTKLSPLFLALALSIISTAQVPNISLPQTPTVQQLFRDKGEVYFTFEIHNRAEITALTPMISIDNVQHNKVFAFANKDGFEKFLALSYSYTILPNPNTLLPIKTSAKPEELLNNWNAYPTYEAYVALMEGFAASYPDLCQLVNMGTLPSGRKLLVLKITDHVGLREDEPQFLYTSSMHGDEIAGYVGMLHYIDYLLSNYGTDNRVTFLVDNMEIWVNPLANPDGTYRTGNNSVNGAVRFNANNVDLNRNYPDPQDGPHPDGNAWQPETVAFMGFADTMNFVMAANFHGGAEVVNYPWDTWATAPADADWWINESAEYANTVMANSPAGYLTSVTTSGYVNGYEWYEVNGGRQDYMNYYRHCREVTVELSNTKLLAESNLLTNWNNNYRSWLNYMEEALHGIRGVVKDACTGKPMVAKVFIAGHDMDNSHVFSGWPVGDYHRPIFPGTYDVTFSAPGYVDQTVTGVVVTGNTPAIVVDILLNPAIPTADFVASTTNACGGEISFTDLTGSATNWLWSFGDGNTSTQQNPTHTWLNSGTYSVSLVVSNCAGADSLVKTDYLTVTIPQAPQVVAGSGCSGTSLMLVAFAQGALNWYDAPEGGNIVSTEAGFITPPLTSTTTYYVENDQSGGTQQLGPMDNAIGTGGFYTASTYHYLRFNAKVPFRLLSVWVNAATDGNRTIQLRNASGTILQAATIFVLAGQGRVDLNFEVPQGEDLQLGVAGANNLFRNQSGATYPYEIDGLVAITGNSAGNPAVYYYFYDWEIQQPCVSPRVPVTATIFPSPPTPTVDQVGNTLVSSASDGNQWYDVWGLIPGATSQVYSPVQTGVYYLVVTNSMGCDAHAGPITFTTVGTTDALVSASGKVSVYPNPTNGVFHIDGSGLSSGIVHVAVYNMVGQVVYSAQLRDKQQLAVDGSDWPAGSYVVRVSGDDLNLSVVIFEH